MIKNANSLHWFPALLIIYGRCFRTNSRMFPFLCPQNSNRTFPHISIVFASTWKLCELIVLMRMKLKHSLMGIKNRRKSTITTKIQQKFTRSETNCYQKCITNQVLEHRSTNRETSSWLFLGMKDFELFLVFQCTPHTLLIRYGKYVIGNSSLGPETDFTIGVEYAEVHLKQTGMEKSTYFIYGPLVL